MHHVTCMKASYRTYQRVKPTTKLQEFSSTPQQKETHIPAKNPIYPTIGLSSVSSSAGQGLCVCVCACACLRHNTTLLHAYIRAKYLAHELAPHYAWARHSCPVTGHPSLRPPRKSAIPRTADRRQPSDTQCRI